MVEETDLAGEEIEGAGDETGARRRLVRGSTICVAWVECRGSILRGSTSSSSLLFSESRSMSDDNVVCFNFGRLANGDAGWIGGGIFCAIFVFFLNFEYRS